MGNYRSWYASRKAAQRSARIDRQIEEDRRELKKEYKVLLLGTSAPLRFPFSVPHFQRLTQVT